MVQSLPPVCIVFLFYFQKKERSKIFSDLGSCRKILVESGRVESSTTVIIRGLKHLTASGEQRSLYLSWVSGVLGMV